MKLKDSNGQFILPITHPDSVIDDNGKTITQKLQEINVDGGAPTEHTHTINDITDINTTNKSNGNVLTYDSSLSEFVLKPLPNGTGNGATNLNGLSDVDTITSAPAEGDTLTFTNGVWKPSRALYRANAEIPLYIETFAEGLNMPIHAKIVKFDSPWNGFRYWMAYTPWSEDKFENPSIAVSNNLIAWETPEGLNNPISNRKPEWNNFDYYSDTDLIYNPDTNKLECWYRWCSTSARTEKIHRKTSSNGITWSEEETLRENTLFTSMVSPSVIYENATYKIWVNDSASQPFGIKYYESSDGYNWQYKSNISGSQDWHFKMERTDLGIEYLGGGVNNLYHSVSQDGITFTNRKVIIPKGNVGNFDDQIIYLACMVKLGGKYYIYYTGRGATAGAKGIGLSISTIDNDITSLRGLTAGSYLQMSKPNTVGNGGNKRPTNTAPIGFCYFDKGLGKPIWKKTLTTWCDANGNTV